MARLIDADRLKEAFKDGSWYLGNSIIDAINEAPTVDTQPDIRWISVEDALPGVGIDVLVYCACKLHEFSSDRIMTITSMSDNNVLKPGTKTEKYWQSPWQYFSTTYDITHWALLPKPPKEEKV